MALRICGMQPHAPLPEVPHGSAVVQCSNQLRSSGRMKTLGSFMALPTICAKFQVQLAHQTMGSTNGSTNWDAATCRWWARVAMQHCAENCQISSLMWMASLASRILADMNWCKYKENLHLHIYKIFYVYIQVDLWLIDIAAAKHITRKKHSKKTQCVQKPP